MGHAAGCRRVYDPATDSFALVAGAPDCSGYRPTRLLDGRVAPFASLPQKNFVMSAVTTLDGSVVAAGGAPCGGGAAYPYFYFLKGEPPVPE